jgi:hypothetical protein
VIEYEVVKETADDSTFDRLTALLIGSIGVLAALLVFVQAIEGQREARANATSSRLVAEITARLDLSSELAAYQVNTLQQALQVALEGTASQLVGLQANDETMGIVGEATVAASNRLLAIATEMGATPEASDGVDQYIADVIGTDVMSMEPMVAAQNAASDEGDAAGRRSSQAVLGISVVALAGVLVGLAAVLGGGRAGKTLLLLAWIAAAIGLGALVVAAGLVASPI